MAALKELRRLRDEEKTLVNIATKLSDQLNRLKVEELALLSMIRQEETEQVSHVDPQHEENNTQDMDTDHVETHRQESGGEIKDKKELVPLDLNVGQSCDLDEEEEEEEEDEDDDDDDVTEDLNVMIKGLN